jgi:hypothetical protein
MAIINPSLRSVLPKRLAWAIKFVSADPEPGSDHSHLTGTPC